MLFLKWRIQRNVTLCYGILHVTHLRKQRLVKENEKIQKEKLGQNQKTRKSERKPRSLSKTHGFENFSHSGKLVDRRLTSVKLCGPGVEKIEDFNVMLGVLLWWNAGTRARHPRIQPYGPLQREMNAIVHVDDDDDDDDTQE